jgi:hypothetical protein
MSKNIKFIVFIFCALVSLQSCQNILDQAEEKRAQENFMSEFMGNYTGSYSGDVSGSLAINVRKDASVEVSRGIAGGSDSYLTHLIMSSFNTTTKSPQGFMLIGNMQTKKGTWEMGNLKGTWTVTKN